MSAGRENGAMTSLFLDTHVVCWLYFGQLDRFSASATKLLEKRDLYVSPIVKLELQYLNEIEKIKAEPTKLLGYLERNLGLAIASHAFTDVVEVALDESWTRDPFDRIIVAHARLSKAQLMTQDRKISLNFSGATSPQ